MKKLSFILLAAGALTLASCSNEDFDSPRVIGDGNYAVTVSLPKSYIASRAVEKFGTGTVADQLNIAVYDAATNSLIQEAVATFDQGSLETTVYFNLTNGKQYNIAFFAQSKESMNSADEGEESNAVYTFDADAGTVTVNYENMTSANNLADAYDCFYKLYPTEVISNTTNAVSVELTRPVGQVNWGTDDLTYNDEDGESQSMVAAHDELYGTNGQYIQTNLTVTNPYTQLNLKTGEVSGNDESVTIETMAAPYTVDFPMENADETLVYTYVAMTYLLAPSENSTNYDLNLVINNDGNTTANASPVNNLVEVSAVPVQANYQTNIYGNLLSDNVQVNVSKNIEWNEPSFDLPQGNMVAPGLYKDGNTYTIMSPAGLENYAKIANAATQQGMSAYTVVLGADLNMTGVTHTPFSNAGATFDGQGHTVSNLTVNVVNKSSNNQALSAGFMSSAIGTVQNINFVNCNISGSYKAGVLAGDGLVAKIENVNITNCNVLSTPWNKPNTGLDDGNNVGAVVGYLSAEPTAYVKNCTVTGCAIVGFRKVGGIVGFVNGSGTISGCTISNTTISADLTQNYYGSYTTTSPNLVGQIASNGSEAVGDQFNSGNTIGSDVNTYILAPKNGSGQIEMNNVTDLQNLAAIVNAGRSYSGQNIVLQQDINLQNVDWTPIGQSGKPFSGNFDGNNKTITGLTVGDENTSNVGFFGYTTNGTIENLNFVDANVTGYLNVGVVAGTPYTAKYNNINITGNIQVNGYSYVGGAFGKNAYGNITGITINANAGSAVKANSEGYRTYVGGVVGFTGEGNITFSNINSNIDVYGSTCDIGGITGIAHYNTSWINCVCTGNVYTASTDQDEIYETGGIAGVWHNSNGTTVTFTGCSFTGKLISQNAEPQNGSEAWNTLNNITGLAYSATGGGTLMINGSNVTSQHLTIPNE